ncbi:MAG: hypothetical protein R3F54_07175 [Alphaproteobacteria bacterium]
MDDPKLESPSVQSVPYLPAEIAGLVEGVLAGDSVAFASLCARRGAGGAPRALP